MNKNNFLGRLTTGIILSLGTLLTYNLIPTVAFAEETESESKEQILEQINRYNEGNSSFEQITSVSQLRDVSPTDWVYTALQSLVERYSCIVGYPNHTFKGNRSLSRYEFAAGLNACMIQMERLITQSNGISKEDIEKLKRLTQEFETELAVINTKVTDLENRIAFLEDNQFSTTTKLTGETIIAVSGIAGGEKNGGSESIPQVPVLGYRNRLVFNTSFTGKDLLFTRLATGNFPAFEEVAGTPQANLSFTQPDNNNVKLEVLDYHFPIADGINLWIEATGGYFNIFTNTHNVLDGDGGSGALSLFGTRNQIFYQGNGSGVALQGNTGDFDWSVGYLSLIASNPQTGNGLFNGPYAVLAQLGYNPTDNFSVAFTYNHGYNTLEGGSIKLYQPVNDEDISLNTIHNTYSLTTSWHITDKLVLGGWGGVSKAGTLNSQVLDDGSVISRGNADFWYWAATFAVKDAFAEGSTAGIILGMQPWISDSNIVITNGEKLNNDPSFHGEVFYEYAVSDNIHITPGIILITNPDNDSRNSTLVIGAIRTTFSF